jgi:hypothetical protein
MKNTAKLSLAAMTPMAVGAILAATLACSGGDSGPQSAARLAYTNSAAAGQNDYRLEAVGGPGGTVTLALRGPSSVSARGMNFALRLDESKARFVAQDGNDYAKPGAVFELGQAPRIFRAALDGATLRVSMAQKGSAVPARPLSGDIATVSIRMQSGAPKGAVALDHVEAKVLLVNGGTEPVQVRVGTLEAQ